MKKMNDLALITGASGGIGKELAYIHASHGDDLIVVARSQEKLVAIKQELEAYHSIQVYVVVADLSNNSGIQHLYREVTKIDRPISYLINNAGFGDYAEFIDADINRQEEMVNLNITALMKITHHFLPELIISKGKIMNVGSVASFQPGPTMSVYFASKAFVLHFSEALTAELRSKNVGVTALCPGPTESDFMDVSGMGKRKIVQNRKLPSAKSVAEYGYRAMQKNKPVAIPGLSNRLLVLFTRFIPRNLLAKLSYRIMSA
jgi:short-subunit dehydrogenase